MKCLSEWKYLAPTLTSKLLVSILGANHFKESDSLGGGHTLLITAGKTFLKLFVVYKILLNIFYENQICRQHLHDSWRLNL